MLVKINKQDKKGNEIYQNALTGRKAILAKHDFVPSRRKENRFTQGRTKQVATSTKISKHTEMSKKEGLGFRTARFFKRLLKKAS